MGLIVSHFNEQVSFLHKLMPSEFIDESTLCRVFVFSNIVYIMLAIKIDGH